MTVGLTISAKENGAQRAPFPARNCVHELEDVLRRNHGVEHRERQQGIGPREQHRCPRRRGFRIRIDFDHAQGFLLGRPNHEPDVEPHDDAQPHTYADGHVFGHTVGAQRQGLDEIAVHSGDDQTGGNGRHGAPAEPPQGRWRDDLADGRFLVVRNVRHIRDLDEVEVPQKADPHDATDDMQPTQQECEIGMAARLTFAGCADYSGDHDDREHKARDDGVSEI